MSEDDLLQPRSPSRRQGDRRLSQPDRRTGGTNLPAVIAGQTPHVAPGDARADAQPAAAFAAQILGQDGQKRGLRGGPEVLEKARASYLSREWSGAADRRPAAGKTTKTEI